MLDAYDEDAPEELRKLRKQVDNKFANPITEELNDSIEALWKRVNSLEFELYKKEITDTKLKEMTNRVIKLESEMLVVVDIKQDYFLFKKLLLMSPELKKVLSDNLERFNQSEHRSDERSLLGLEEK